MKCLDNIRTQQVSSKDVEWVGQLNMIFKSSVRM